MDAHPGGSDATVADYLHFRLPPGLFAGWWREHSGQGDATSRGGSDGQRDDGGDEGGSEGVLVVALTRPDAAVEAAVRRLLGPTRPVRFVVREVRIDQLDAVYARAVELVGDPGSPVTHVEVDEVAGRVAVHVGDHADVQGVRGLFPEAFVAVERGRLRPGRRLPLRQPLR